MKRLLLILLFAILIITIFFLVEKILYKSELTESSILFVNEPGGGFPSVEPTVFPLQAKYPQSPTKVAFYYYLNILTCTENHFWHANQDPSYPDQNSDERCKVFDSQYLADEVRQNHSNFRYFCGIQDLPDHGLKVDSELINGNKANVKVHLLFSGSGDYNFGLNLSKKDGVWKISSVECP